MEQKDIVLTPAVITFDEFEIYKKKATEIAAHIRSFTLTEDNVPEVKEELANARRLVNALDTRRKEIKNELLAPYKVLEVQVKELTGIIDEADNWLRSQVRELEEAEREGKQVKIKEIWDKRIGQYSFPKYITDSFERFLEPRHLNKSTSMKSVENDMVGFMEGLEHDIEVILGMPEAEDVMVEYVGTLNITDAISNVQKNHEVKERMYDSDVPRQTFIIEGQVNIEFTKRLLTENGIPFKTVNY